MTILRLITTSGVFEFTRLAVPRLTRALAEGSLTKPVLANLFEIVPRATHVFGLVSPTLANPP